MKSKFVFTIGTILALLAGLLALPSSASAATSVLLPVSYTTTAGGDGGQPVANIQAQDQSGSQNDWNKYVEFTTPSANYAGYRTYTVPGGISPSSITAIQITANFLGPAPSTQTWTWKIYNWNASTWVTLGTNAGGSWSSWKLFTFNATGTMSNYVSGSSQIRIRLQSNNAKDNADLDYEAVTLTYTSGATSTPTNTPLPSTPTFTATPTSVGLTPTFTFTPTVAPPTATFTPTATVVAGTCTHYVATTGNDSNSGTLASPWRTVQKAANTVGAGSVVCVRAGMYNEAVTINVSGSAGAYITFQNYPGETVYLDGTGITVPAADNGMFFINNKSYIIVQGFEIQNYKTSTKNRVPIGIRITGTSHHIEIRNNKLHHIEHNGTAKNGTDAHGIAIHGTSGSQSVNNIIVDGNQLYNLKLGSSEALVINGNVEFWQVTNNIIHDVNNIGIDAIGFEDTAPSNDQARDGLIAYNDVYNITSAGNVAYGNDRAAGCIYVDGGTRIMIEYNKAHNCNLGIEIASEHSGTATSYVTVRNNFIYNNTDAGLGMGGYDNNRGSTENCVIVNNTFYNNASINGAWGAELYIQYDTRNNIIRNNVFYAKSGMPYIQSWSPVMTNNAMNNNLFYNGTTWQWKNVNYSTFAAYQSGTGNDANSLNNVNPLFVNASSGDLHLQAGSPAINVGVDIPEAGAFDIDGQARLQGASIDMGADERE
ncbi:MAG: hypothetical protein JETCAE02_02280 [Anaerolineaceae bacterium]|nr:DUF1565 domain-containing protein [Anaerolineae bacterium AMX1]WKZ53549.1 MAG: choice-of-anchor Q domain-containing protein [Anaerolineales bacterium]GIK10518.1 MAG: hypothetical protein BroJett001_25840 [Chloroflexota bacterium]GJQ37816.1 MAG: hypothetical protein JETCAE02_02280 [Anaerolineaceae bacterium]HMN00919.1 choice-of-anchor Q domain-containing protein [Anaerolineales bacterium]